MNLSIKRVIAIFAASSMLSALLRLTAARAQDVDPSTTTSVTGTWTGTDSEAGKSQGPMTMVLTQTGNGIGGTFSVSSGKDTPAGNVTGNISKGDLKLTFHTTSGTNHPCVAKVLATVDETAMPPTMSGTFLVKGSKKHCKGKGTFDLTEQ
jgi:hypothetical protein